MTKLLNSLVILHVTQKNQKYQYCAGNHSERHLPEKMYIKKKNVVQQSLLRVTEIINLPVRQVFEIASQ